MNATKRAWNPADSVSTGYGFGPEGVLRVLGALLLASSMMTGGAKASSFVVIAAPKDTVSTSFVVIGAPPPLVAAVAEEAVAEPQASLVVPLAFPLAENGTPYPFEQNLPTKEIKISASIIAFDSPIPNVAYEKVAAITPQKVEAPTSRPVRFVTPMVMRAGIIGEAFARAPSNAAPVAARTSSKNDAKPSARAPVGRKPELEPEEPVKIIIAPPPPSMPKLDGIR